MTDPSLSNHDLKMPDFKGYLPDTSMQNMSPNGEDQGKFDDYFWKTPK